MPHMRRASTSRRGAAPAASIACAAAAWLLACAARTGTGAPPLPEARARDLVIGTERFELHANAYVALHTWLWDTARQPDRASDAERAMDAFAPDVAAYRNALASGAPAPSDADLVERLRACVDDACARAAVRATPFEAAFGEALPRYVQSAWHEHAATSRAAMERATPLLRHEAALVRTVSKDLAMAEGGARTRLDVVAHSESERAAGGVVGARGACFAADGILECGLFAMGMAGLGRSKLAAALRAHMGPRELTVLWGNLVAWVVAQHVQAVTGRGSRLERFLKESEPRLARWLARAWPEWRADRDAAAFAKRIVDEVGGD
jgi:hypothetical protein